LKRFDAHQRQLRNRTRGLFLDEVEDRRESR
jgi:hypothetical protein